MSDVNAAVFIALRELAAVQTLRPKAQALGRAAATIWALERPLPHYGAQSWIVFDGARAVARGSWPPAPPVVRVSE